MQERLGIAGSGAIACGLAATAARHGEVVLWARADESADRARASVEKHCGRLSGEVNARHVRIETDLEALGEATFLVEAIAEQHDAKAALLGRLGAVAGDGALIATTTSSLSVAELAQASGSPERFVGLHVFNPVPKMKLVELAFPPQAGDEIRARARALCEALGKTPVEVPDVPGFVVNRLLFPYLFSAVELLEQTGMAPADVDRCMTLGTGHPMGPLALLDFIGLDVAVAIGDEIGAPVPERLRALVAEGALGRKSGRGLYAET
ncbi:MAG TPA: 3-hydroxyacyl-CoA dehydrogenase family protein [Solirubrobacteraceae bacterium]|nr:3-hydroxyacyl-CoA dehydrogenase family protein [Solirubrobacteraceae bacterium]